MHTSPPSLVPLIGGRLRTFLVLSAVLVFFVLYRLVNSIAYASSQGRSSNSRSDSDGSLVFAGKLLLRIFITLILWRLCKLVLGVLKGTGEIIMIKIYFSRLKGSPDREFPYWLSTLRLQSNVSLLPSILGYLS